MCVYVYTADDATPLSGSPGVVPREAAALPLRLSLLRRDIR